MTHYIYYVTLYALYLLFSSIKFTHLTYLVLLWSNIVCCPCFATCTCAWACAHACGCPPPPLRQPRMRQTLRCLVLRGNLLRAMPSALPTLTSLTKLDLGSCSMYLVVLPLPDGPAFVQCGPRTCGLFLCQVSFCQ